MKRFITVIIILLIVTSVVLIGAWLFSRHTAQKNGTSKPTFRQFLSGETTPTTTSTGDGSLSSVFVDDNLATTTTQPGAQTIGTQVAQFTNSTTTPSTPTQPTGGATTPTNTPGPGAPTDTTTTTTVSIDPTTQTPAQVPPIVAGPECSDADLNIQFTPQELIRLQALQNRFYALSQTLHTDADVSTETGNHDNFKSKVDTITALYNKCVSRAAMIPVTSQYKLRVPTPFWHELSQDAEVFVGGSFAPATNPANCTGGGFLNPLCLWGQNYPYDGTITISGPNSAGSYLTANNTPLGLRSLERSLRLNLW